MRRRDRAGVVAVLVLGAAGCTPAAPQTSPTTASGTSADAVSGKVTVLGAASLTDVFTELADEVRAEHPGLDVALSFAGSSTLVGQVRGGAPADVVALASADTMRQLTDAGLVAGQPRPLARNVLEVVIPDDDPGGVEGIDDLADPDIKVALCAPQVPCGAAAQRLLAASGVQVSPATLEQDVRAVLSKVALGEADAGLVYATDVRAGGDRVTGIPVPAAQEAATDYLVAVLADAPNPAAARAFVDHAVSRQGRAVLDAAGFLPP
jgi:molybdate transport system substrate-binding protein